MSPFLDPEAIDRILASEAELREAEIAERIAHDRQAEARRTWRDAVRETAKRRQVRDRLIRESLPDPDRHPLFDHEPGEERDSVEPLQPNPRPRPATDRPEFWSVRDPRSSLILYYLADCDWREAAIYRDEHDPDATLEVFHGTPQASISVRTIADQPDKPPDEAVPPVKKPRRHKAESSVKGGVK